MPACAFFFFKAEVSYRSLIPLLLPGSVHSGAASSDDCGRMFPDKLRVSSFPLLVPILCLDSFIVSPLRLRWVKGLCVFRCNLPPALLAERPGSFTCHCGNSGVERTPNKSQHTKLNLEKKFFSAAPAGIQTRNLSITSSALLQTSYPGSLHNVCSCPLYVYLSGQGLLFLSSDLAVVS